MDIIMNVLCFAVVAGYLAGFVLASHYVCVEIDRG